MRCRRCNPNSKLEELGEFDPEKPYIYNGVCFDPEYGSGAVSNTANINYRGFVAFISPKTFLNLAYPLLRPRTSSDFFENELPVGKWCIGPPMLYIVKDPETDSWEVSGHEGRHRTKALQTIGFDLIPVYIIPYELRAKNINEKILNEMSFIYNEEKTKFVQFNPQVLIINKKVIAPSNVKWEFPIKIKTKQQDDQSSRHFWSTPVRFNPDEDIRRLERDANLGDVNDEAKLIIAKVRAGIIPSKHVALAAYLEDPAALATGIKPDDYDDYIPNWALEWSEVRKVLRFGGITDKMLLINLAVDFAEHTLHIFENEFPNDNRPKLAIQILRKAIQGRTTTPTSKEIKNARTLAFVSALLLHYPSTTSAWKASVAAEAVLNAVASAEEKRSDIWAANASSNASNAAIDKNSEIEWQTNLICDYLLDRRQV